MAQTPHNVIGTWRPVAATLEVNGKKSLPYGPGPQGKLTFTSDLHFVEFLHDPRIPRFKSDTRGEGTNKEATGRGRARWPAGRRDLMNVQCRELFPFFDTGHASDWGSPPDMTRWLVPTCILSRYLAGL